VTGGPHEELRALLQRYARAADARDVDGLAACFDPEAEVVGSRGRQTVAEWLDTMRGPRAFPVSMHVLGDPLLAVDDDGARAELDTYAVVYQLGDRAAGGGDLTLGIRYRDEAVLRDGRWVLRRRVAETLWMR
jgi:hypothetical protein